MVPQAVIDLLAGAFPGQPLGAFVPTVGGFSNLTCKVSVGGRELVVKAASDRLKRDDVRREAHMLALLRTSGLPVAPLVTLLDDSAWTVEVLEHVAGTNAVTYYSADPSALPALYRAVGQVLSAVHGLALPAPPALQLRPRYEEALLALPTLGLDAHLLAALRASLEHEVWRAGPAQLVHGDAGLHNLLWDGRLSALLDWEWAGWGNPLLDLAWIYWILRLRRAPEELWGTFLAAYAPGRSGARTASGEELRALALGHIAFILVRAFPLPSARQEWLRRAVWTIDEVVFPAL